MTEKEVNELLRKMDKCVWNKKPWKGRKRTMKDIYASRRRYLEMFEEVTLNMPWEDYFEFSDFAARLRPEVAIDFAFRLGFLYGNGTLKLPEDEAKEGKQDE